MGDASGIQSPLSFGGFGALTRHLGRISGAVTEALKYDCLTKEDLGEINQYTPNLSAAWMFQKVSETVFINVFINMHILISKLHEFSKRQCQYGPDKKLIQSL